MCGGGGREGSRFVGPLLAAAMMHTFKLCMCRGDQDEPGFVAYLV